MDVNDAMREEACGTLTFTDGEGVEREVILLATYDEGRTWWSWFPHLRKFEIITVGYPGEEQSEGIPNE